MTIYFKNLGPISETEISRRHPKYGGLLSAEGVKKVIFTHDDEGRETVSLNIKGRKKIRNLTEWQIAGDDICKRLEIKYLPTNIERR